jgi:hydrogenase maturation protease
MISVIDEIKKAAETGACFVGVGNELRGDDAAGLVLFDSLKESLDPARHGFIRAEDIIESYITDIVQDPRDTVIIIDAAAGIGPGSLIFGLFNEHGDSGLSTHRMALRLTGKILNENGKQAYLLGIGVRDTDYRMGLNEETAADVSALRDLIIDKLH